MVNVESVGGHLIIQHYREVHSQPSSVEMYSDASRVYLFHLVPVTATVRWRLALAATSPKASTFTCTVDVNLPPLLQSVARLTFLGRSLPPARRGGSPQLRRRPNSQARPAGPVGMNPGGTVRTTV